MIRQELHQTLVAELLNIFLERGYKILGADGVQGYPVPRPLHNDGYGDQRPKSPDIHAYDEETGRFIIGEAKTGEGDLETEHSLTQYNVYLDQFDKKTGKQALVYFIVPSASLPEFNTLLTHYIHPEYWPSLVLVSSTRTA
ncbi:MAG: hypothetical protein WEB33_05720 [Bacteroidota bacterium]